MLALFCLKVFGSEFTNQLDCGVELSPDRIAIIW